jgi:hypothetical protein
MKFVFSTNWCLGLVALAMSSAAVGQSHALIDKSRSSEVKNLYVSQSIEGEFGRIRKKERGSDFASPTTWRGYGIRNGLGVEIFRFTQFAISHTLLNIRSKESSLENLRGSRLAGEMNFAFSSPMTNIQFGLGVAASQLEYQNFQESGLFVGGGTYYTMGFNYFMSPTFSIQLIGKHFETRYTSSGGSLELEELGASFDNLGVGINIWL